MDLGRKEKEQKQKKKPGRVPTSCAECRRLKLRCDRNVPCEKCVSRGCGSICPYGVLKGGRNGRLILANTEELHDRIEELSSRNLELEDALRKLQENVSDQPHPLLGKSVLRLDFQQGSSSSAPSTSSSSKSPSTSRISPITHPPNLTEVRVEEDHNAIDAFGTLVINRRGESNFLGRTARAEYLAQVTNKPQRMTRPTLPRLTNRIMEMSFPESELCNEGLLSEVLNLLPLHSEALHLCDVYLEYGKFLYSPMPKKELLEETLALVYRAKQFGGFEHYHPLSLLFIVFAIATLFNPNKQPFSTEAHEYYYLSRTALNFAPPFQETTLTSVQTLIHMAQYLDLSDMDPGSLESAWMYVGQAVRLGQRVGLHFNSSRWKLHEEAIQRRHDLFWRLFVSDTWTSLHLGRPPSISRTQFDCPYPSDHDLDGVSGSFDSWNVRFSLLLNSIMEAAFGPKQPVYTAILDFDRKIRDFDFPIQWRTPSEEETTAPPPDVSMYRWLVLSCKEIALLNLHRAYFAQALQEAPADLQRHRYLPSVMAIYRSAWRLIHGLAMTWMVIPKFLARVNLAWSHGLSAAIVMCLFITRAPTSHLTTAALEELDNLTSLFDSSASSCRPAAKLLTSVQSLRRKAHEVVGLPYTPFHLHYDESSSSTSTTATSTITTSELDRLNGKTCLHSESRSFSSMSAGTSTADPRSRATSVTISDIAVSEGHYSHSSSFHNTENLHPALTQDVSEFGVRSRMSTTAPSNLMSFFDYPSDPSIPTPAPQSRDTPPDTARQPQQLFQLPPRMESLPQVQALAQAQYFHPAPHHDPFSIIDPRRMGMGFGLGPGGFPAQSGFSGGFAASPIALDSSWHSFVEQLGF